MNTSPSTTINPATRAQVPAPAHLFPHGPPAAGSTPAPGPKHAAAFPPLPTPPVVTPHVPRHAATLTVPVLPPMPQPITPVATHLPAPPQVRQGSPVTNAFTVPTRQAPSHPVNKFTRPNHPDAPPTPHADLSDTTARHSIDLRHSIEHALRQAVEATGDTYHPRQWTINHTGYTIATRITPHPVKINTLVISEEMLSIWVTADDDIHDMLGVLSSEAGLTRLQIVWALGDITNTKRGAWIISPTGSDEWVCTQYRTLRRPTTYKVLMVEGQPVVETMDVDHTAPQPDREA